jgi:hypothetical protein
LKSKIKHLITFFVVDNYILFELEELVLIPNFGISLTSHPSPNPSLKGRGIFSHFSSHFTSKLIRALSESRLTEKRRIGDTSYQRVNCFKALPLDGGGVGGGDAKGKGCGVE